MVLAVCSATRRFESAKAKAPRSCGFIAIDRSTLADIFMGSGSSKVEPVPTQMRRVVLVRPAEEIADAQLEVSVPMNCSIPLGGNAIA